MAHYFRSSRKGLISILITALILVLVVLPAAAVSSTSTNNVAPLASKTPDPTETPDGPNRHFRGFSLPIYFDPDNPCFGPASVKVTYDGVSHTSNNKNGAPGSTTFVHYSVHGTFDVDPVASSIPTYNGRFHESGSYSYQVTSKSLIILSKRTVTTVIADGMLFHITFHHRTGLLGESLTVENFACAK